MKQFDLTQPDALWQRFVEVTGDRPPRDLLQRVLELAPNTGEALDLGCGAGNETLALLRARWSVTAIDGHAAAIASTLKQAQDAGFSDRLTTEKARFESLSLESERFDLIHAGFALPFTPPAQFDSLWAMLAASLRPGGLLAAQLFGVRDQWNTGDHAATMSFHSTVAVDALLNGWERLHHEEHEQDGKTALDDPKHWHVHHIIARRLSMAPERR